MCQVLDLMTQVLVIWEPHSQKFPACRMQGLSYGLGKVFILYWYFKLWDVDYLLRHGIPFTIKTNSALNWAIISQLSSLRRLARLSIEHACLLLKARNIY